MGLSDPVYILIDPFHAVGPWGVYVAIRYLMRRNRQSHVTNRKLLLESTLNHIVISNVIIFFLMVSLVVTSIWRLQQISKISKSQARKLENQLESGISLNICPWTVCDIVIGFFFAYRQAFLADVLGHWQSCKASSRKKIIKY